MDECYLFGKVLDDGFSLLGVTILVYVDDSSAVCQQESSLNRFDFYQKQILKQAKRCQQLPPADASLSG